MKLEKGKLYSLKTLVSTPWNYCFLFNSELSSRGYGGICGIVKYNKDIFVLLDYKKEKKSIAIKILLDTGRIGYLQINNNVFELKKEL
jgi:hypothetical protein